MKKNTFIVRGANGRVIALQVDDKSNSAAQTVTQWIRERRLVEYGALERDVTIGTRIIGKNVLGVKE